MYTIGILVVITKFSIGLDAVRDFYTQMLNMNKTQEHEQYSMHLKAVMLTQLVSECDIGLSLYHSNLTTGLYSKPTEMKRNYLCIT